jgi:hypothetical protein
MSFVADMTPEWSEKVLAVGWLHPDHPYTRGEMPTAFVERLNEFARRWFESIEALGWGVACGYHTCEFCGKAWGSGTFGVPFGDRLFYAPEMIAHYAEQHGYAPPAEFVAAVLASPLPGTQEYATAVAPFVKGHV